jgi:hypothetical protein
LGASLSVIDHTDPRGTPAGLAQPPPSGRIPGQKSLTNIISIVSKEWLGQRG